MIYLKSCPRCKTGDLSVLHGEASCIQCGYVAMVEVPHVYQESRQRKDWISRHHAARPDTR